MWMYRLWKMLFLARLNCSFSPLTFPKLRFWLPKKKNYKTAPKFCNCSSSGPQSWYWLGLRWRGTLNEVPRVIFLILFLPWGSKLLQLQNLGGYFVVFFLGGQNRNFENVRGLKLQLSLLAKDRYLNYHDMYSTRPLFIGFHLIFIPPQPSVISTRVCLF